MLLCTVAPAGAGNGILGKDVSIERGRMIFVGGEPITGRLRDHKDALPPEVVVCGNCHRAPPAGASPVNAPPMLTPAELSQYQNRRNGPPSAYSAGTFCKLLRTGVDPVFVVVAKTMPIFIVDDQQCESLWTYLMAGQPSQ